MILHDILDNDACVLFRDHIFYLSDEVYMLDIDKFVNLMLIIGFLGLKMHFDKKEVSQFINNCDQTAEFILKKVREFETGENT